MEQQMMRNNELVMREMFAERQRAVGLMAKEIAEREFELFEFNLFVSSFGKKHLVSASKSLKGLREAERKGKIDLKNYEKTAEEF